MAEVRELRARYQRRRVWLGPLPACHVLAERWLEGEQPAPGGSPSLAQAAAEFVLPRNHVHFGLLGGSFIAATGGSTLIRVAVAESREHPVDWTLAPAHERVFAGLPAEYADHVLAGALAAPETPLLGPGTLVLDHAAHGEVGSNAFVFRWLAQAVVRLLGQRAWGCLTRTSWRCSAPERVEQLARGRHVAIVAGRAR